MEINFVYVIYGIHPNFLRFFEKNITGQADIYTQCCEIKFAYFVHFVTKSTGSQ